MDIVPYRSAMVPPLEKDTHYIYGRSDQVLAYIAWTVQRCAPLIERAGSAAAGGRDRKRDDAGIRPYLIKEEG
ncbi:hypothetical protein, partial [Stenotrophomonas maltophilia group sp. RNC7]|uniref:hypothetical protein n=2 Tax=Bacteria TaxID=2 RepID=UPI0027E04384